MDANQNSEAFTTLEGQPFPLGAFPNNGGVNFALFSECATAVELCLYDDFGQRELQRIALIHGENHIWHIFVDGLGLGAKYGYRVHGPYEPEEGLRFNANKLLIDPYARELDRSFCWDKSVFGYDTKNNQKDLSFCEIDNAYVVPKCVVTSRKTPAHIEDIQSRKPRIPWSETVIYEAHVRGLTQLNLTLPSQQRGTLSGLANTKTIKYLKALGVTAVELLPIHSFIDEEFLVKQGLSNFWGYNTLNFFIPHHDYLESGQRLEFISAVEQLHEAGLEVILDVVYNHTAESNEFGPTLCFRGIDNTSYYRLEASSSRHYINDTGCGNTIKSDHPRVMQMILDSLRYWAGEMGVDGFRFDLASILGRDENGFSAKAAFFQAISQDPLLSTCKMIAEPWDIGPGGYQLGAYPGEWSEWNDKYRDICRRFWRGESGVMPEFASRIHGSNELFEYSGRGPRASLNFITSHDGFSLADVVSYKERNNFANKENNRDGHHSNFSDNYGVEGPTDDTAILTLRQRQQRNMIATLMLSHGTPMLLAGDEVGRTQQGNNNAYCQDNEINWIDWRELLRENDALLRFTQYVIALRKSLPLITPKNYIHFTEDLEKEKFCARWISSLGLPMNDSDWHKPDYSVLGWILQREDGQDCEMLLMIFNAQNTNVEFNLPVENDVNAWEVLLDTVEPTGVSECEPLPAASSFEMDARSMRLLRAV